MNYYIIPEIAGRLLVGPPENAPSHTTYWMDVRPDCITLGPDKNLYFQEESSKDDTPEQDLEKRVAALKWFYEKSQQVGSVFYLFSPPRVWEMAAMCLMARWGWTKKKCAEIICALDPDLSDAIDFNTAEKAYQTWLERGTSQR